MKLLEKGRCRGDMQGERACRAWARVGGIVLALVTWLSMAYAADWKIGRMMLDPLAWMMAWVAMAAGVVCGYALGIHLHASSTD